MALKRLEYVDRDGLLLQRRKCPKPGCSRIRRLRRAYTDEGFMYWEEEETCGKHKRVQGRFSRVGNLLG
jgi:hypothetical protein